MRIFFVFILIFIIQNFVYSINCDTDYISVSRQTTCLDKNILFNVLNLTDEQVELNKNFLENDNCANLFHRIEREKIILKSMEKSPIYESFLQKHKIKTLQKALKKEIDKNDKEFKKTLTRAQKSKYSMIKKLQQQDIKREAFDYSLKNKQLPKFGNP